MYSYEEHPEPKPMIAIKGGLMINPEFDIIKELIDDLVQTNDPAEVERVKYGRTFKTGDWVTFNHDEYPEHISREPWQITHWSFQYNSQKGTPQGRIHKSPGMSHDEDCLRYAHQDEINYYISNLPWIYNKEAGKYEKIEIFEGRHFKIGSIFDSRLISSMDGRQIITAMILLNKIVVEKEYSDVFSKIFEKLK